MNIVRKTFPVGPLQCNCTIIGDTETGVGYVFDPGGDASRIMATVESMGLKIIGIIHTHAHLDHILAAGEIQSRTAAPIWVHRSDMFLWDTVEMQCRMFGVPYTPVPDPDHWIEDEQELECGGSCIHTPGHTPGSTSFYFEDSRLLIAGDTLFQGSIGRTDFEGGDAGLLVKSIQQRIYKLDESATVITGHGPETTIGQEMRFNAFVRA
ncbi:MAG: MBL fold metallo-hydrolase [Gammaproteobacteria bacterium]|nr:MAG: MBL fold metallo-hydrolase [Gammaproteobacteria bacterium]